MDIRRPPTQRANGSTPPSHNSTSDSSNSKYKSGRSRHSRRSAKTTSNPRGSDVSRKTVNNEHGGLRREDVIRPTLREFRKALDFRNYKLVKRSQTYSRKDAERIPRWKRRMATEMEDHKFDGNDKIRVLSFLVAFRSACDTMGIHEGAAVYLITSFMSGNPQQDLKSRLELRSGPFRGSRSRLTKLSTYCQVINYLLGAYADNQIISRSHNDIIRMQQLPDQSPVRFKDELWKKMARCGPVYSQETMTHYFVEGLNENIRNLVRQKHLEQPDITLARLSEYARDLDHRSDGSPYQHETPKSRNRNNRRRRGGTKSGIDSA